MKKLLLFLFATLAAASASNKVFATEYQYSQYCLQGFRSQFSIDTHYPEYAKYCGEGEEFHGNIDDPELYQLAGTEYTRGASPTAINWELQPLVKYLYGLFSFNPLLVQYLFAVGIVYLLVQQFGMVGIAASILFLLDGLTREQLTRTYLDLGLTFFVYLFIYFLSKYRSKKNKLWPAMISLGLTALSKSFSIGIIVGVLGGIYLFLTERNLLKKYLFSLWQAVFVYILGYSAFFFYHSPLDFLTLHVDILRLYNNYVPEYPKGEVFRIIFTGQWLTWYGDKSLIPALGWTIFWPLSILSSLFILFKKIFCKNNLIFLHLIWIIIYLIFLSFRLVFPRYLVPILPSLYLLLIISIGKIFSALKLTKFPSQNGLSD